MNFIISLRHKAVFLLSLGDWSIYLCFNQLWTAKIKKKKNQKTQMCSWKFPQTQNRKLMLGLKLFVEFVVAHRKLRKILWPPSVLLENRHKNKEKSKASTSNTYNQRGNHRDDAGPALSLYILFIF